MVVAEVELVLEVPGSEVVVDDGAVVSTGSSGSVITVSIGSVVVDS